MDLNQLNQFRAARNPGYPLFFRRRVMNAAGSVEDRAWRFGVCERTIENLEELLVQTGGLQRPQNAGRHTETPPNVVNLLRWLYYSLPDTTADEAINLIHLLTGVRLNDWNITRNLQRIGFTRKKARIFFHLRNEERRMNWWNNGPFGPRGVAGVSGVPVANLIDIDECSVVLGSANRRYGCAPKGGEL